MLRSVMAPKRRAASGLSVKPTAGRLNSSSDCRALPKVVAGERRRALDDVEGRGARLDAVGLSRQNLQVRRQRIVVGEERRVAARERSLIDQRQPELRRRLDDLFGAIDVGDTWKLHQDLVGGRVARDHRFGDAQLVDPAVDGAKGLLDDLIAERARDGGGRRNV